MKQIILSFIAIILFIVGKLLLQGDYIPFLQWWITILYLGIIFMPLTTMIFHRFHDKGYLFSKSLGVAVVGYLMWFLSSLHLMKFTLVSCLVCVIISIIINCIILLLREKYNYNQPENNQFNISKFILTDKALKVMVTEELLFFALFLLFTYVRGFKPEAYGTEKFMDYGFMTSMMRCDYMPPQDFWFSGTKLNYYYVGQFFATFLTKLSAVKVSIGYNLMLMMVGAFTFVLSYSLIYNVVLHYMREKEKKGKFIPPFSGIIAGAAVCLAGNMHYPVFEWLEPLVRKFFGIEASTEKYWFPNATRFIGYHPETTDKAIHEFPAYSFVLGDLHAHVINIMFVLTILGLLFAWQCTRNIKKDYNSINWNDIFNPAIILIAFFIGLFHTTNFWDFPIYYVVSGAIILVTNIVIYDFKGKRIILITALQGIFILLASFAFSMPFHLNFDPIATAIRLTVAHTPLNQLIILWGLPVFIVIAFLCFKISDYNQVRKISISPNQQQMKEPIIQTLIGTFTFTDLFIVTIGLCSIGLILIPEIVYIKDIYDGDYKRANTMFKLTYQAFIMFGLCIGYIILRLLCFGRTIRQKKVAVASLILFVFSLCYIQNAVNAWYGNIFNTKDYKGLDATAFMETQMPDDELAINWLNENIMGNPIVLEAPGKSYTDYERVSVMTGLPTVLGWYIHEWLWKSDTTSLDKRTAAIEQIYIGTNEEEVRQYLKEYHVSYIYVGKLEQDKYTSINHVLLKRLGEVVFISPENDMKTYETYIVKISN